MKQQKFFPDVLSCFMMSYACKAEQNGGVPKNTHGLMGFDVSMTLGEPKKLSDKCVLGHGP